MNSIVDFESDVLKALVESSTGALALELSEQIYCITKRERKFTGKGFFTRFEVNHARMRDSVGSNFEIECTLVPTDDSLPYLGFILYIRSGILDQLEGFVYGEEWPNNLNSYSLANGSARCEYQET